MSFWTDTFIIFISQVSSKFSEVTISSVTSTSEDIFDYSQVCFFAGGVIFFVKHLFKNYEIRHVSVQLIFSTTFALSLTMFELIIFEIMGVMESKSRYFYWRLELTLLLLMVIVVIPIYIAYWCVSFITFGK